MTTADPQFEGVYGPYTITEADRTEVQRYRLALMAVAAALLVVLALRKFGMDAAADVGDKSVFAYLDGQLSARTS